jgi:hypothetical protein
VHIFNVVLVWSGLERDVLPEFAHVSQITIERSDNVGHLYHVEEGKELSLCYDFSNILFF